MESLVFEGTNQHFVWQASKRKLSSRRNWREDPLFSISWRWWSGIYSCWMEYAPEEDPHFLSSSIYHSFPRESPVPQKNKWSYHILCPNPMLYTCNRVWNIKHNNWRWSRRCVCYQVVLVVVLSSIFLKCLNNNQSTQINWLWHHGRFT